MWGLNCLRTGPGNSVLNSNHITTLNMSRPHEHRRRSATTASSFILVWILHQPILDALASLLCNVFWKSRLSRLGTCFVQVAVLFNVEVISFLLLLFSPVIDALKRGTRDRTYTVPGRSHASLDRF